MPTYRCNACGGLYVDPQPPGIRVPHVCGPLVDAKTGRTTPRPGHRDENIVLDRIVGKDPQEGRSIDPAELRGHIRAAGLGRVKLADDDVLSGADADAIAALQQAAGVAVADEPVPGAMPQVDVRPAGPPEP